MYVFNINILACIDIYSYVFWDMYVSYKQMMPALKHRCASLHADPQQPQVCLLALLAFEYFPSHLSFWPCPSRRAFARCDARSRNVSLFFLLNWSQKRASTKCIPENSWLEDCFNVSKGLFSGPILVFRIFFFQVLFPRFLLSPNMFCPSPPPKKKEKTSRTKLGLVLFHHYPTIIASATCNSVPFFGRTLLPWKKNRPKKVVISESTKRCKVNNDKGSFM